MEKESRDTKKTTLSALRQRCGQESDKDKVMRFVSLSLGDQQPKQNKIKWTQDDKQSVQDTNIARNNEQDSNDSFGLTYFVKQKRSFRLLDDSNNSLGSHELSNEMDHNVSGPL